MTTPLPYKYETLITPRELYFHGTPGPYSHSTPAPYSHSTPAPIFTTPSPFLHSAPSYHSRPSRPGPYTAEKDRFEFKKELPYVSSLPKTQYGPNHLGGGHIETSDVGHFGILTGSHLGNSGGSHIGVSGGSHLGNPSSSIQSANYGNKEFITHTGNLRTPLTIVLLADISAEDGLGKTHIKKSGLFSGRTTKRGRGGNPPRPLSKKHFFSINGENSKGTVQVVWTTKSLVRPLKKTLFLCASSLSERVD